MTEVKTNILYFGDNLDILRKHIPNESIDLIYLDPPFNSKRDYNILFKENGGLESEAQIQAFTDTWHWTKPVERAYYDIVQKAPNKVSRLIDALHGVIGQNDVMAYLVMMTIRLVELHRVLKPTGSLYLHCDPTMSHYIKIVLDQIFQPANFRNEIVWKRTTSHGDWKQGAKHFGRVQDVILFYTKDNNYTWNTQFVPFSQEQVEQQYNKVDIDGRKYRLVTPTAKKPGGDTSYKWKGVKPPTGRFWAYSKDKMEDMDKKGLLYYSNSGQPYIKYYLEDRPGVASQSIWTDINLSPTAKERLHYQTQKPLALLERIIQASSNEGDVVLDPFCGCGTAVVAAQNMNRKWIGIDITHIAINLVRNRLRDSFPSITFRVIGEPTDVASARTLANQDKLQGRYNFQYWATGKIGAHAIGDEKKGADKGIDGVITFIDNFENKANRVIVQCKSGHIGVATIRELRTVAEKEAMGVLITLEPPTEPMKKEALAAGYYHSPVYDRDYQKIQILTIEEILQGKTVDMPPITQTSVTFTKAPKVKRNDGAQMVMEVQADYSVDVDTN
jgi:site-specific DNA-methyltransferase (adenine-specific)